MTTDCALIRFRGRDGVSLSARLWAAQAPRAILVVAHGHGEHSGCYDGFAQSVRDALGVDVLAFDFRGHGLSDGKRGVVRRYEALIDDLDSWIQWTARERPGLRVALLGHSNGGLVAIRHVERRPSLVSALIVINPALRLIARAPLWKRLIGRLFLWVAPGITLSTGIESEQLTQSADSIVTIETDPLRHQWISPPSYFGMVANGPLAIAEAVRIMIPTLVILGAEDSVTDPEAGRQFFGGIAATNKTLEVFEAMRHEPLHELSRDEVIASIVSWLGAQLEGG